MWKYTANPAGSSPANASKASAAGASPNSDARSDASVATTSCVSFSYTARSQINPINRGTSPSVAARIVNSESSGTVVTVLVGL